MIKDLDSDLLTGLQAGEEGAQRSFFDRHANALRKFLIPRCRSESDVEDIVSLSFEEAFRDVKKFSGKSALRTWLFKIAENNAKDFYRSKESKYSSNKPTLYQPLDSENSRHHVNVSEESQFLKNEKTEKLRLIEKHLSTLSLKEQRIIHLRNEGYLNADIAEILKTTEAAVKMGFNRAIEKLSAKIRGVSDHTDKLNQGRIVQNE